MVAAAEGGTLFLDEIDSLSSWSQVKLLRLLQEREFRRLGETQVRRADVRFVTATNADLRARIQAGQFREDLFFRLHVMPVRVEPLARRREDIALLTVAFIDRYARQYGLPRLVITEAAWERMLSYSWPGNIRELENCVRRLIACQLGRPIEPDDIRLMDCEHESKSDEPTATDPTSSSLQEGKREVIRRFEVDYLQSALRKTQGNIAEAAKIARKHRRAFFELLRKYDIDATLFRGSSPRASGPVPSRRDDSPTAGSPSTGGVDQDGAIASH